jgi:hypothetical protein
MLIVDEDYKSDSTVSYQLMLNISETGPVSLLCALGSTWPEDGNRSSWMHFLQC